MRVLFPGLKTRRLGVRGESKYHYVNFSLKEDQPELTGSHTNPPAQSFNDPQNFAQSFRFVVFPPHLPALRNLIRVSATPSPANHSIQSIEPLFPHQILLTFRNKQLHDMMASSGSTVFITILKFTASRNLTQLQARLPSTFISHHPVKYLHKSMNLLTFLRSISTFLREQIPTRRAP